MASRSQPGTLAVEQHGGTAVIRLFGEHDMVTAPELRSTLRSHIEAGSALVISVAEAQFIDSTVVSALFDASKQLRTQGKTLVMHTNTASIVKRLLEVVDFGSAGIVTESMEAAIHAAETGHRPSAAPCKS